MASVTLAGTWLHDQADLAVNIELTHSEVSASTEADGQMHIRAGGRVTSSSTPARTMTMSLSAAIEDSQYRWLIERIGRPVLVRTPDSELLWAVYWQVPSQSRDGLRRVELTVQRITRRLDV